MSDAVDLDESGGERDNDEQVQQSQGGAPESSAPPSTGLQETEEPLEPEVVVPDPRDTGNADAVSPEDGDTVADGDEQLQQSSRPRGTPETSWPTQYARRQTPIAPESMVDELPRPLVACGCGSCSAALNPLNEDTIEVGNTDQVAYYADTCEDPRPVTVETARKVYAKFKTARFANEDTPCATVTNTRSHYRTILDADRRRRRQYDALTTVLLSLRLSPTDDAGEWLSPVSLDVALTESWSGGTGRGVRGKIQYEIGTKLGLDYDYVAVTAGTRDSATPHLHVLLWIDDPDREVTPDVVDTIVQKHRNHPQVLSDSHAVVADTADAGTIQRDPQTVAPDGRLDTNGGFRALAKVASQKRAAEREGRLNAILRATEEYPGASKAAYYVAAQLPHWCIVNRAHTGHAPWTALEAGATAWASPTNWVTTSQRVTTTM